MKLVSGALLGLYLVLTPIVDAPTKYKVTFSSYRGGIGFDSVRDVAVDSQGNIVVERTGANTARRLGDTDTHIPLSLFSVQRARRSREGI